jgi:Cu/Ag efflux pump CusA
VNTSSNSGQRAAATHSANRLFCHLYVALRGVSFRRRGSTIYALTGGLILQKLLGYNFSVAVWVGYIALFGIAVETGVAMVVYLHEALDYRLKSGVPLRHEDIEAAVIEGLSTA